MTHKPLIIAIILLLFSCKKDRIKDEYLNLIGTWKWTQSNHTYGWCDTGEQSEILTPENQETNFKMEIFKKGIIKFYQNNDFLEKDRIVFSKYSGLECDYLSDGITFEIYLNNDKELSYTFNGCINKDSLIVLAGFPYDTYKVGCESYISYFVRE